MDSQEKSQTILIRLFALIFAVKIFHYRTERYSSHKTADNFVEKFLAKSDLFLEVYQGKYGRIKYEGDNILLNIPVLTDDNIILYLSKESSYISNQLTMLLNNTEDSDLLNIKDELQTIVDQTRYLLTFK